MNGLDEKRLSKTKSQFIFNFPLIEEDCWGLLILFELLDDLPPQHNRLAVDCFLALVKHLVGTSNTKMVFMIIFV